LPSIEGASVMRPYLTVDAAFLTPEGSKSADARSFAAYLGEHGATPPSPTCANALPMPVSTAMNPAWDPALQAMRKVLRGTSPPGPALEEAKARYENVMRPPSSEPRSPAALVAASSAVMLLVALWLVRRTTRAGFKRELRASLPAYR